MTDTTLDKFDVLIHAAIADYPGMGDFVPAANIQLWLEDIEIFEEIEANPDLGPRLWIVPDDSDFELSASSSHALHGRGYVIGFATGGDKVKIARTIERLVQKAVARLYAGKKPDGTALAGNEVDPAILESIAVTGNLTEHQKLHGPAEWMATVSVKIFAQESHASLIA